jgi:DNA-binding transcriptional LysR family regulator
MNINDYRYITTIADLGSFTSAAKELYVAQPSLSQRVKYIEENYGITIFIRDTKGVHLTEEGKCFVRYAKKIMSCEDDLRKEIFDMHDFGNNTLHIGTTQFINSHMFDNLILRFHEKQPYTQFEFTEQKSLTLQQLLLNGKLDLAVCYLPIISPDLQYEVIYSDRFVLIPAKGSDLEEKILAQATGSAAYVNVDLLNNVPFAIASPGTRLYECVMSIQKKLQIKLSIQHFGNHYTMLYSIAKKGVASTILYESFFDPSEEHEPYYFLEGVSDRDLSIAITWRKDTYNSQAAKELINIAHELNQASELPPAESRWGKSRRTEQSTSIAAKAT